MAGVEAALGLVFLAILSLGVVGAVGSALLRGRQGLREAVGFAAIWLVTIIIALLVGWLDRPLRLVLG
jgi:hypothetical protein